MPDAHRFYVLTESSGSGGDGLQERFERALADAIDEGMVDDAVIAKSGSEAAALWHMRDLAIEVSRTLGPHVGFDVSLRIADMDAFAGELEAVARGLGAGCQTLVFGHAGDGNLHLAVSHSQDTGVDKAAVEEAVYDLVRRYGGSISAEHGIGISRRAYLGHTRTSAEIDAMRALKRTLDPYGILNRDRVLEWRPEA
jgi:FAD/FMN-containing dehydrogenase